MRASLRAAALATTLLLTTAACGSDPDEGGAEAASVPADAATAETPTEPPPEEAAEPEEDTSAGQVRGVVTVDGTSYDITELRNCEPIDDGTIERELELQGLGEHEGERVQIDVYLQKIAGTTLHEVSWAGPEGVFGGPEDPNVTLDAAGTSVRGVATLFDSMTQTDTVEVDFDLEVPAETIDCR